MTNVATEVTEQQTVIDMLDILERMESEAHMQGNKDLERRLKTVQAFLIEVLTSIPQTRTLKDKLTIYHALEISKTMIKNYFN